MVRVCCGETLANVARFPADARMGPAMCWTARGPLSVALGSS
jgi:hypothetical protein